MRNYGFTDLRVSHAHGIANEDSVWPSFTDIMTVIVMIFLMALVVILIRNVNLVAQLRETMQSERRWRSWRGPRRNNARRWNSNSPARARAWARPGSSSSRPVAGSRR
ncbi:MAG: hypothetical protein M5U09_08485 [Gammaproteobacteria bacterium]|nr:hypothetical protein [Gammaproteobacteria bacterium]